MVGDLARPLVWRGGRDASVPRGRPGFDPVFTNCSNLEFSRYLGIPQHHLPVRYLGALTQSLSTPFDKIRARVQSWTGKTLSTAGRGLRAALGRELLIWGPPLSSTLSVLIQNGKWTKPTHWHLALDSLWDEIQQLEVGGSGPDILIWPLSRSGILNFQEAWKVQRDISNSKPWADLIWQPMQSQRHSFCSWKFFHDKLSTRDKLLQKDRGGYGLRDNASNFIVGIAGRSSLPSINLLELQDSTTVLSWIRGKGSTLPWTTFKLMRKFSLEVCSLDE
ncbi:hypothetical protein QJS10_CPA01g01765 [Acorus calamus]|uniref:Reverse transcriptase zinc-binding domain-containing protein n=1 Tax=Acorus calamus TaxID=4465 RepID=A0AAV9FJQ2_ACOCL|nr:hypothetical protein QJS10_CPA01g01765 [Acorus calamus]